MERWKLRDEGKKDFAEITDFYRKDFAEMTYFYKKDFAETIFFVFLHLVFRTLQL